MKTVTDYLFNLRKFGKETGAIRAARALEYLGNPQDSLSVIHVAGTNGKGSVCSYINSVLRTLGYNVGMFTSPHLVKVNERIRYNDDMITDEEFKGYYEKVRAVSDRMVLDGFDGLAFFDFVFVMSVLYYADKKPDFVIFETGLGGKSDATAALSKKLLSVIVSISYDHTEILGNTLSEIAAEKAGIIADNTPVVCWNTNEEVSGIIEAVAGKCNSKAIFVDEKSYEIHNLTRNRIDFSVDNSYYKNSVFSIRSLGVYQVMNAVLSLCAISVLSETLNVTWDERLIMDGIANAKWAGRMEEVEEHIYLDGAHNPDGISCFLETAKAIKGDGKMYLLFGAVCEKDYELMIKEICDSGCFDGFVITEINNHRALSADVMAKEFVGNTKAPVVVEKDNAKAYNMAKELMAKGDVLMCAGSLYLVGALKELLDN